MVDCLAKSAWRDSKVVPIERADRAESPRRSLGFTAIYALN